MTQTIQRTVLFGDLRGSTALYETLGNTEATAVVTHRPSGGELRRDGGQDPG
jgi:class 3 adenylate cyclase